MTDVDDLDGCTWLEEEELDDMLRERGVTNEMLGYEHVISKRTLDRSVAGGGYKHWPGAVVHYKFDGSHSKYPSTVVLFASKNSYLYTCVLFVYTSINVLKKFLERKMCERQCPLFG